MSRLKTVDSILDTVGDTPLIQLRRIAGDSGSAIFGKLEARNPGGSVKDRIGIGMIRSAEEEGLLKKGMTIVEPTSGNTGIGLALAAAALGYRLILTMPDSMSLERRLVMGSYGAEILLTPGVEDMRGAVRKAEALKAADPEGIFMPRQFDNPANPRIHQQSTGREILDALDGELDAFVAGVGTGGTLSGVGRALREEIPDVRLVAVEPAASAVLSGAAAGRHGIQGIGAGFIPRVLDLELIDQVVRVAEEEAFDFCHRLAREEGLLVGPSSGANVAASVRVAAELGEGARIATVLCDTGFRYFSVEGFIEEVEAREEG